MNKLYISGLLLITVFISSCGQHGGIPIENIHNKQQLDSIIATLPKTDVQVDSSPVRILNIGLKGNFSYYGEPVTKFEVETINEALVRCSFYTSKNALDVLNAVEKNFGTGIKERYSPDLSWNTAEKTIQFGVQEFDGNLLTLSNKEKAYVLFYYNNAVNNSITTIYNSLQPSAVTDNYKLDIDNSECGYRIYINGLLAVEHLGANTLGVTANINQYLVKGKQQKMTVELLPGNDFEGHPRDRLHLESVVTITMNKWSDASNQSPEVFQFRTPSVDSVVRHDAHSSEFIRASKFSGQLSAKVEKPFEIAAVPYELPCYAAATDIRNIPDAKEKILAHYQKLRDAYVKKDWKQLETLLYPYEQNKAIAYYLFKPTDGQAAWKSITEKVNLAQDIKLAEDVTLFISADGRFAKLLPAGKSEMPAFYLEDKENIYPLDYYTCINKNGDVQFALN